MAQDVEAYALTLFLTRFMGIAASYVLILELTAKIANIIVDPLAGVILDRKGKHGRSRAKAFTLVMPFPLAVSSILLFVVPGIRLTARIVYVFVFYLIYCISDGFYDMSLSTISARMTTNPNDRKNFYTFEVRDAESLLSMFEGFASGAGEGYALCRDAYARYCGNGAESFESLFDFSLATRALEEAAGKE